MSTQINEIEIKHHINKNAAFGLIQEGMMRNAVETSYINQVYLFDENATAYYNREKGAFDIILKHKNKEASFTIFVKEEEKREILNKEFQESCFISCSKSTFRVRYLDGKPIFTFKRKIEGIDGNFEFEVPFADNGQTPDKEALTKVLSRIKSRVEKIRYTIAQKNGLSYEIDMYKDEDFITLEIEFKTIQEMEQFDPNYSFISDWTDDSSKKNKNLAKAKL